MEKEKCVVCGKEVNVDTELHLTDCESNIYCEECGDEIGYCEECSTLGGCVCEEYNEDYED